MDKTARVWDAKTGKQISELRGHTAKAHSALFSPDGKRVVTASEDRTARVWDLADVPPVTTVLSADLRRPLYGASFSPDGARVVTASEDNTTRVWDANDGHQIHLFQGHTATIIDPNEQASRDGTRVFSPDGTRVLTAFDDGTARVWDAQTGVQIALLTGHKARVNSVAFSLDGTRVITTSDDKTAWIWNVQTGEPAIASPLKGHEAEVTMASFSPDGTRVITASKDQTARVWDAKDGHEIAVLPGKLGRYGITTASFSPDGTHVIVAAYAAQIWGLSGANPKSIDLNGHTSTVLSAAFSPDGTRVVTAAWDSTARVWDVNTGQQIYPPLSVQPASRVTSASFSPDGKRVVIADGETSTAHIWDLSDAVPVATVLRGHKNGVTSASFSPDGKRVVTASADGTAIIYPVPQDDDLRDRASQSVHRCLTTNQRLELGLPPAGAAAGVDRDRIELPSVCQVPDQTVGYMSAIATRLYTIWTRTAAALWRRPDRL